MVLCVDASLEVEDLSQLKYGGDSLGAPVVWKERSLGTREWEASLWFTASTRGNLNRHEALGTHQTPGALR